MLPDRVSNPGPLTYESGALPIALRGPAPNSCMQIVSCTCRTVAHVTIHANASNMASATLEHAAVEK